MKNLLMDVQNQIKAVEKEIDENKITIDGLKKVLSRLKATEKALTETVELSVEDSESLI